jgi:hypothetical protein
MLRSASLTVLVATVVVAAHAHGAQVSSYLGSWQLDVGRSTFDPGPPLKSELRTYERSGADYKVTLTLQSADGQHHTSASTYRLDGKPYAVSGNPNYDSMSARRINARETRGIEWRDGKAVGQLIDVVAPDGKSRTITQTVSTRSGRQQHNVMVFLRR